MMGRKSLARSAAGLARYYMDCGWWRHPHFVALPLEAIGLYSAMVGTCNEQATDGWLPADPEDLAATVGLRVSRIRKPLRLLIERGRLEVSGDQLRVVGFSDHNPTTAEIGDFIEERSRQGTRGNHVRWHENKGVHDPTCEYCTSPPRDAPPDRSSDRCSDPPGDPPSDSLTDPEAIANRSHGMGWDGRSTSSGGVGSTGVATRHGDRLSDRPHHHHDDQEESADGLLSEVAEARAHRLGKSGPTDSWVAAVARSLDATRAKAMQERGMTASEIDLALDRSDDPIEDFLGTNRANSGELDPTARPPLRPVAEVLDPPETPVDADTGRARAAAARQAAIRGETP